MSLHERHTRLFMKINPALLGTFRVEGRQSTNTFKPRQDAVDVVRVARHNKFKPEGLA